VENSRLFAPLAEPLSVGAFYTLVSGESPDRHSAPARTAWEIERLAALRGWPTGEVLGSEASLRSQLGVSRETLREAIRIVESRGAMKMRRGRAGGLALSCPSVDGPAASLAAYLRAVRISPKEITQCVRGLDQLLAWELARRTGPLPARWVGEGLRHWLARASGRQTYLLYVTALDQLVAPPWVEQLAPAPLRQALKAHDPTAIFHGLAPLPLLASHITRAEDRRKLPVRASAIAVAIAERAQRNASENLGSEASLCEEFRASRAVIRQALRVLQDLDVIKVRLGRGGGYTLKQPSPIGIIRQLFVWLAARNCCPFALNALMWNLNAANLRLAGEQLATMSASERDHHCDRFDGIITELRSPERFVRFQQALAEVAACPMVDTLARCVVSYQARSYGDPPLESPTSAFARSERTIVATLRTGEIDRAEQLLRQLQDRTHEFALESTGRARLALAAE
jgi:DNA-binding FadR family transcriptional regulator